MEKLVLILVVYSIIFLIALYHLFTGDYSGFFTYGFIYLILSTIFTFFMCRLDKQIEEAEDTEDCDTGLWHLILKWVFFVLLYVVYLFW